MIDAIRLPSWCRDCDPRTRLVDHGNYVERCRNCHPFWEQEPPSIDPGAVPEGRTAQIEAIAWLRFTNLSLRQVETADVRELMRKFFNVGWSPNDIAYALGHEPDGSFPGEAPQPHDPSDQITQWLRRRLNSWCDEGREPLLSLSQLRHRRAEAVKEAQRERAHALQEQAARVAPPYAASTSGARAIAIQAAAKARRMRREAEVREQKAIAEALAEHRAVVAQYADALNRMSELTEAEVANLRRKAADWREDQRLADEP